MSILQDILMLEAGIAALAVTIIGSLFARVYFVDRAATAAFYTAVAFYGVAINYTCHVLSWVINEGNECLMRPFYFIRIVGFTVLCMCAIYSGWNLLFLNKAKN